MIPKDLLDSWLARHRLITGEIAGTSHNFRFFAGTDGVDGTAKLFGPEVSVLARHFRSRTSGPSDDLGNDRQGYPRPNH
jgi:hypothetical protein